MAMCSCGSTWQLLSTKMPKRCTSAVTCSVDMEAAAEPRVATVNALTARPVPSLRVSRRTMTVSAWLLLSCRRICGRGRGLRRGAAPAAAGARTVMHASPQPRRMKPSMVDARFMALGLRQDGAGRVRRCARAARQRWARTCQPSPG